MDFYADLQRLTEHERGHLLQAPILAEAMAGKATRAQYRAFLAEAYHHVRHTVPLLMACGSRLPTRLDWLREAVVHYVQEEVGHEKWILDDIRAAGGDADTVRDGRPRLATELMVAYAYDTIQRNNPVSFFGMVFVLEGTSVRIATNLASVLQRSLDLPASAFSYLSSHGSLDLEHIDHFGRLMNRLEDAADRAAVVHAAKVFFRLYGDVIRSVGVEGAL
ncbi:biliverdin-producing heme oxygenase [Azoarcus sp. TTM-91]|uniref:TenA family transcriptional regulator n=1 Tax=Azoarcus sp. TTM-91 TaxID=2691581 RepID=UPI00145E0A88|nr:iron-containing redox enzyme family protein [Azoarcus sp. TTM-91]NMG36544.1 biliverdin-producing heme oxygenase [Azoarcus sp. TTM-91]